MGYEAPKPNNPKDTQTNINFNIAEMRRLAAEDAGLLDDSKVTWNDKIQDWVDENGISLKSIKKLWSGNDNTETYSSFNKN